MPAIPDTKGEDMVTTGSRQYALGLLLAVFALNFMDRQILAILLQPIKEDLHLSDAQLGLLSGFAFALFFTTVGIPLAQWADRGKRRRIIAGSLAVFSGMTALCGLATNFWQLALARTGVGVGEAGTNPASHSIIADLYPMAGRSTAMAVFALGPHVGLVLGFVWGGWANQWYGWRVAFLAAGLPGLLLAAVLHWTLREPARGHADGVSVRVKEPPSLAAVCRGIWAQHSLRHVFAGATLASFLVYSVLTWLPAALARTHHMGTGAIGLALALIVGVAGGAGTYLGGRLADALAHRGEVWRVRIVALGLVAGTPWWIGACFAETPAAMLSWLILPGMLLGLFIGPTFAIVQALVDVRSRAVAAAILLFVFNLVGLGLGPLAVGALSDLLEPRWGVDSLRFALLIVVPISLWGACHYARAGRTLGADLARVAASQGWADASGPVPIFIPLSREPCLDGSSSAERRVDSRHRGPFQP